MGEKHERFDELCRQVGAVVIQCQILEGKLALLLAISRKLELQKSTTDVYAAFDSDNRKTIERLMAQIRKQFALDRSLDDRIEKAKDERNWMVHRLQRETPDAMDSPESADAVLARIQALAKSVFAIVVELDEVGDSLMVKHGFDLEQMYRNTRVGTEDAPTSPYTVRAGAARP